MGRHATASVEDAEGPSGDSGSMSARINGLVTIKDGGTGSRGHLSLTGSQEIARQVVARIRLRSPSQGRRPSHLPYDASSQPLCCIHGCGAFANSLADERPRRMSRILVVSR